MIGEGVSGRKTGYNKTSLYVRCFMRTFCLRCKKTKSPDEFYGDYVYCKECKREEQHKRYEPIKAAVKSKRESIYNSEGLRMCRVCKGYKDVSEYDSKNGSWDRLSHECKECRRVRIQKNYAKTKGEQSKKKKEWYAKNREHKLSKGKEWRANNLDAAHAIWHRYKARKTNNGGSFTAKEWEELVDFYSPDGRCLCCKEKRKLHKDHVVPIIKGGVNNIGNIQPLCKTCNSSKGGNRDTDYRSDGGEFARSLLKI